MELLNREIIILKLLVQEKSITRAAEISGLQQPAVSKILRNIEQKLERKLFLRTSSGLKPSSFALELAQLANQAQSSWENSIANLLQKEARVEGTYGLGSHPVIATTFLTGVYSELVNKYPHLNLNLVLETSKIITQRVASGELHFGIVANPVRQPELVIKSLIQERVHLYQNQKLTSLGVVYYNPDMVDVSRFIRKMQHSKLIPIRDYQLILSLVTSRPGQGAILPSTMAEANSVLTVASKAFYKTDIKLIYRTDLHKSIAAETILEKLKAIR